MGRADRPLHVFSTPFATTSLMTTKTERSEIKGLHGIESSSRSSVNNNYRDASNGTPVWKKNPTLIQTPVNAKGRPQTSAAQVLSQGGNPRGGGFTVAVGNTTSRRTMTACPPRKKMKIDEDTTFGGNVRRKQPKEGRPVLAPEIIEVDDEDLHPSTDDMLLRSPRTSGLRSTIQNHDTHSSNHAESSRASMSRPPRSGNVVVPDGKDTEWLERKIDPTDDDPIALFSDEETNLPKGKVKSIVNTIEAKSIPQIDLRKVKPHMKPRTQLKVMHSESTTPRDHIATSSTNFFNRKDSKQTRATPRTLPVKEFFIGTKLWEDKPSILTWSTTDCIEISHGGIPQLKAFDVRSNCSSVTYTVKSTPFSGNEAPVVKLDTFSAIKRINHKAADAFKSGAPFSGSIVVKFDTSHPDWAPSSYQAFTQWLSKHINKSEKLSGQKPTDSVWEQQSNHSCLFFRPTGARKSSNSTRKAVATTSSKKRAAPDESASEDEPATPPRAVESRAASRTSRRPTTPIEIASPPGNVVEVAEAGPSNLRRSTRRSAAAAQAPQVDPDEVILVYPHGVPGAVNITNADMGRLDPGEFLNDTLIEFGLKLWLRELEDTDPELAKQIHVFSSFFYKKLNKKNFQEGYNSVRKWTSRFDLFQKKYIIVPINENLHWYFAIIYEPEHVLLSPAAQRQTRSHSAPKPTSKTVETIPTQNNSPIADPDGQRGQTMSETEVEEGLHDFQSSCSITATSGDSSTTTTTPREQPTTASIQGANRETPSSDVIDIEMDNPLVEEVTDSMDHTPSSSKARSPSPMKEDDSRQPPSDREIEDVQDAPGSNGVFNFPRRDVSAYLVGIPPSKFYASSKNVKDKPKEIDLVPMEIHDDAEELYESSAGQPQTHIITLDSLGGPHKQAVNQLAKYLRLEAKDKKGIDQPSSATGLVAAVPTQPNFCDCGVYLLHLAQTFMKNPQHYFQMTLASSNKKAAHSARRLDWNDSEVGQFRENMARRIRELSGEWKQLKEEVRKKEAEQGKGDAEAASESDSEVDIVEVETIPPRVRPRTGRHGPAARVRG